MVATATAVAVGSLGIAGLIAFWRILRPNVFGHSTYRDGCSLVEEEVLGLLQGSVVVTQ